MHVLVQPKFQAAVPFTPVTGARILVRDSSMREVLIGAAAKTLMQLTGTCHVQIASA